MRVELSFYNCRCSSKLVPVKKGVHIIHYLHKKRKMSAVHLHVVSECRAARSSQRFRPGNCFSELNFRYLSPRSEREKCRPLDHMSLFKISSFLD